MKEEESRTETGFSSGTSIIDLLSLAESSRSNLDSAECTLTNHDTLTNKNTLTPPSAMQSAILMFRLALLAQVACMNVLH